MFLNYKGLITLQSRIHCGSFVKLLAAVLLAGVLLLSGIPIEQARANGPCTVDDQGNMTCPDEVPGDPNHPHPRRVENQEFSDKHDINSDNRANGNQRRGNSKLNSPSQIRPDVGVPNQMTNGVRQSSPQK